MQISQADKDGFIVVRNGRRPADEADDVLRPLWGGGDAAARPVHHADAASVARLLNAEHALGRYGGAHGQSGDGLRLRALLRHGARHVATRALERAIPGVKHVRDVVALLSQLGKKHNGVAAEDKVHAVAANEAYKHRDKRADTEAMRYLPEHSSDEIAVYKPENQRPIAAFRGTATKADLLTDAALALGNLRGTDRYKRNAAHIAKVREALGPLDMTGHSLGGAEAQLHARDQGADDARTIAFAPGTSVFGDTADNHGRVYMAKGDPVSALSAITHKDVRVLVPKADALSKELQAHSMSNYVDAVE